MKGAKYICVLLLLLSRVLAQSVYAQSVAVDKNTTFQTWKSTTMLVRPCFGNADGASIPTAEEQDTFINWMLNLNVNAQRSDIRNNKHAIEPTNDNTDPFVPAGTAFSDIYTAQSGLAPCPTSGANSLSVKEDAIIGKTLRQKAIARGFGFEFHIRLFGAGSFSGLPTFMQNGTGSTGEGEQEMLEMFREVANVMLADGSVGYCPDYFSINEPSLTGYFAASPFSNDWTGELAAQTAIHQPSAGCPSMQFMAPMQASSNSNTKTALDAMALVTSGVSSLGRVAVHCYTCLTAANWAAIYAAYPSLPPTVLEEADASAMGFTEATWTNMAFSFLYNTLLTQLNSGNIVSLPTGANSAVSCRNTNPDCSDNGGPAASRAGSILAWSAPSVSQRILYRSEVYYAYYLLYGLALKPGNIRVDAPVTGANLAATAWKDGVDGNLIVVLMNNSASTQSVSVTGLANVVHDKFLGDPSQCTTTGENRCSYTISQVTPVAGALTVSMVTKSIVTLVERPTTRHMRTAF